MQKNSSFYFFNNEWAMFHEFHSIFKQLLTESGQKKLEEARELKNFQKQIKPRQIKPIFKFLEFSQELEQFLTPEIYKFIPKKSIEELNTIHQQIALFKTQVRTVRSKYKSNDFFEKLDRILTQFDSGIQNIINQYQEAWSQEFLNDHNNRTDPNLIPKFEYYLHLWNIFELIKRRPLIFEKNIPSWLKNVDEGENLPQYFKLIQQAHTTESLNLAILNESDVFTNHHTLSETPFRFEWFYLLHELDILHFESYNHKKPKAEQKKIREELKETINQLLVAKCKYECQDLNLNCQFSADFQFNHDFSPKIIEIFKSHQDFLSQQYEGNFQEINTELQKTGAHIFQLLDRIEHWFEQIEPLLKPYENLLRKYINVITHLRGNLERQIQDFEDYTSSVEQNNTQIELEKRLAEEEEKLSNLLREYQDKTLPLVHQSIPEIEQLETLIKSYNQQITQIKSNIDNIFKNFKDRKVDLQTYIQRWEHNYEIILNQSQYTIRNEVESLFNRFNQILDEETSLFHTLDDLSPDSTIPKYQTREFLRKDGYSEAELRHRIQKIDEKMEGLDDLKTKYIAEKQFFVEKLEAHLKENGLESKKCIICHKPVNVAEDHFVKCEFCGALSHYSCSVVWLDKYNSCPVCHHRYTMPNNSLYDPEQIEH